jgi:arylsulfatase
MDMRKMKKIRFASGKRMIPLMALAITQPALAQKKYQQADRPNIILINMDDMGYGDTEPYGMTGIPTPHFNQMAQEGTRFTHFNAGQPVSTASRAALLTGCYPTRVGMTGALLPWDRHALNPEEETIASVLKRAGYDTALFGKWHLGNKAPFFPTRYGFDIFYGIPYSHDIWPVDYDGFSPVTNPGDMRSSFPLLPMISQDIPVDTIHNINDADHLTTIFTEKAVAYITDHQKSPFFLLLNHPLPHVPLAVSDSFKNKSELGLFGDVIMELDWSLGQIMEALERTKLADNTILIVTADNGPWLHFGNNAGSAGALREGKFTTFEGGNRVPFLIRWPGQIKAGGVCSELMTNMDILPTLASITNAPLPQKKIDGLDFKALLKGETIKGPREVFYYYFGHGMEAIRYKHWKLILPHRHNSYEALQGKNRRPGITNPVNLPIALYDLAHDPGERYDVSFLYPEVIKQMMVYVEQARDDLGDSLTGREGRNIRPTAQY